MKDGCSVSRYHDASCLQEWGLVDATSSRVRINSSSRYRRAYSDSSVRMSVTPHSWMVITIPGTIGVSLP